MKQKKSATTRDRLAAKSEAAFKEDIHSFVHDGVVGSEVCDGGAALGERALWRAVITQALMDAGSESKKPEMKFERAQAISWLSGLSPDFSATCLMAGFDPLYIRQKAKEAIARGCAWRKDELRQIKRQRRMASAERRDLRSSAATKNKKSITG